MQCDFEVIVVGGGHAGAEAAWAAANLGVRVALVTLDAAKIGAMSCNPAIGGLAKGQMVREIDALGGLMGLAADATGIQFRILNRSKGPAVQGPRCQSDKYRYAREVQRLLGTRRRITILSGSVEAIVVEGGRAVGVKLAPTPPPIGASNDNVLGASPYERLSEAPACRAACIREAGTVRAGAVVLTTGTFMRGLLHTGPRKVEGGRIGEAPAVGISDNLRELGFELGRLKTGTPPRLAADSLDLARLAIQPGDDEPVPFSDMTAASGTAFPVLPQKPCWVTHTNEAIHRLIRANLDRAPMYNGQIKTTGPRYCPSIEDKVMRFADKGSHHVFLEPESLDTDEIYCNGISTSLPADVQDAVVHGLPGCERARILRYGYAVEYDMVWPHQIDSTCMTKRVAGLFLAGQINGTSGYEEAAGQGLMAGLNAVRYLRGEPLVRLRRDQAYIGVLLDDLITKTPREPYRMFTSRAEHRLVLRSDNAAERLTVLGREWGLVDDARWEVFRGRSAGLVALREFVANRIYQGQSLANWVRRPEVGLDWLMARIGEADGCLPASARERRIAEALLAEVKYAGYLDRQQREVEKLAAMEQRVLPGGFDYARVKGLGKEARASLERFRPATLGQASRLEGITPSDLMLLAVALGR